MNKHAVTIFHHLVLYYNCMELSTILDTARCVTYFQMICLLFLCPDFDLHSVDEIATYT
jgi:hypothetical protein